MFCKCIFKQCIGCAPRLLFSGFGGLIDSLMSELPSDLVSYNRPVRCIHWIDGQNGRNVVEVECDDGERIVADHVIVTVPLGKFCHTSFTAFLTLYMKLCQIVCNDTFSYAKFCWFSHDTSINTERKCYCV